MAPPLEAGKLGSWELSLVSGTATGTPRTAQILGYVDLPSVWSYDAFLLERVFPEDRDHVAAAFRRAVDTGTEWHFECRIHRANDNEVRWIEAKGRTAGDRSSAPPTHLLGIVADITARKVAEEALRRSYDALEEKVAERTCELVDANAKLRIAAEENERIEGALRQSNKMEAIGQLTGGLAHDFNNLPAGISGSLELIRTRAAQGRTAEFGRYIETALASTHRAAALTHRLLAFARRQTLDPKPTDLNQLIVGVEELFSRTVGPSIQIDIKQAGNLSAILCNPNQLESALLNLVINARDAMPDGGHLTIETTNTVIPDRRGASKDVPPINVPPRHYVTLSVTDTGAGMTPDVLARAFDPFFTTKPLGQGTGLGLSMIHGFVEQSGGQVRPSSEEGQGTRVMIYLPRHVGALYGEAKVDAAADLPGATSAVVLVVEDELPVRMVVVDVLSDLGYTVLEAGDGRAGLRILESTARVDFLLTDVGLPGGMNGRQLADASRQQRPNLKVLFMTGYADSVVVGNGLLEQGMQVMTKPFALDALAARVQGIMND